MKSLLILRHAEAVAGEPDERRPLSERGRTQARDLGRILHVHGVRPQRVLCSSAVRAEQTANVLAAAAGWGDVAESHAALYNASAQELMRCAAAQASALDCVMMVAHAPGVPDLVSLVCSRAADLALVCDPATLAEILLDIDDWAAIGAGRGALKRLLVT